LQEGARVMLVGRSAEKLAETSGRLGAGDKVATFVADACDENAMAAAVKATVDTFGEINILLANAGTEGAAKPLETQTREEFEAVLNVNVVGVWLAIKHCVEPLRKSGGGSIIALSSIAGMIGFPGLAAYSASKHAVFGLVKSAALELAASGIRVNAIGPGPIDNRMILSIEEQLNPGGAAELREMFFNLIPMKRYGTNEEVANLALYLASDESSYCSGAMYPIDGGFTAA
jgi:NAD(P)-dependent dehydrogenase (short-subunit alcohol dehydrogenase family)